MLPKVAIQPAFEGTKQAIVCLQRRPSMLWNQPVVRPGLTDLLADGVVSDAMARCTHMASGRVSEEATNTAPKDQLHREGGQNIVGGTRHMWRKWRKLHRESRHGWPKTIRIAQGLPRSPRSLAWPRR